jgi:hypothetical protein
MSHTIRKINLGNTCIADITILDYVQGGETFTLAELGLTSVVSVGVIEMRILNTTSPSVTPKLSGGKVLLMDQCSGEVEETPSTVGLNFTFLALVRGL